MEFTTGIWEFTTGFDGIYNGVWIFATSAISNGSAATDVSAFWLKSVCCQVDHVDFSQNAETLMAAEGQMNLQRDFKEFARGDAAFGSAATDVSAFWLLKNPVVNSPARLKIPL